jgi:transcriptional regulator with XRE-family HTH domain
MVTQILGGNVRRLRKGRKLTLEGLVERSGLNYTTVSEVERARCSPNLRTVELLATGLGVEVETLFRKDGMGMRVEERIALMRRIRKESLAFEVMDPLTGDWWTPQASLMEVLRIHPKAEFRVKGGAA